MLLSDIMLPEHIKVFAMRHGEPDLTLPKYLGPGLTERAKQHIKDTSVIGKILGTLIEVNIDAETQATRREEAEGVALKEISDLNNQAKSERRREIHNEIQTEIAAEREAKLNSLAANGTKLAVISSRVKRAEETAQIAAETLDEYGMLHRLSGEDYVDSHLLSEFSETFPQFKVDITARDIVNAVVSTIYPPLKPEDLEPVSGLVMVMHEPLLYSMSPYVLAGQYIQTPINHGEVMAFEVPRDGLIAPTPPQT